MFQNRKIKMQRKYIVLQYMVCVNLQHTKRPSVDELLSHPLLLARFFPARPDNTLTRPLQPSTNESDLAVREAEIRAREQRVNQHETELEKRAAELDGSIVPLLLTCCILYMQL